MEPDSFNEINMFDAASNKEKNSFAKKVDELSKEFPSNSNIPINNLGQTISSVEMKFLCEELKENKPKIQNLDKIQLVKIKDENYLESGIKIETFLNSISDINDEKFIKCEECKIVENNFFCSICERHFCKDCCVICKYKKHIVKDLNYWKIEIENYKKNINILINKFFFPVSEKEKKEDEGIEKKETHNFTFDSNEFNKEIEKSLSNYKDDIRLIITIIDKNYINYYHFQNIEECYAYLLKKNPHFSDSLIHLDTSEDRPSKVIEYKSQKAKNIELIGVGEYIDEIYINLLLEEKKSAFKPKMGYMLFQHEITEIMRTILIDWIIDIHFQLKLKQETLFMTIWLIDSYLSFDLVLKKDFQLLGITCLFISSKFHDIIYATIDDLICGVCNKQEMSDMENKIIAKLNFYLISPNPLDFYNLLFQFFSFEKKHYSLGVFFIESALTSYQILKYSSSVIACSCAYIIMKYYKYEDYKKLYNNFILNENDSKKVIQTAAKDIFNISKNLFNSSEFNSLKKKYKLNNNGNFDEVIKNWENI